MKFVKKIWKQNYIYLILMLAAMGLFQNCSKSTLSAVEASRISAPSMTVVPIGTPGYFLLSVARAGSGTVTSLPAGIDCGVRCGETFVDGSVVTLTATASSGFVFRGWGGACSGAAPVCTVSLISALNVTVNFESSSTSLSPISQVISAMPANSWKALPGTKMESVCPDGSTLFACETVISAWSGGTFDETRSRMIIHGGGHADSWYNNMFAFDLEIQQWKRLTEMPVGAGAITPAGWTESVAFESCGYYPKPGFTTVNPSLLAPGTVYVDRSKCFVEPVLSMLDLQQPRSSHTYGGVFFDLINDRYCSLEGNGYPSAQTEALAVKCFDLKTGLWTRMADRPDNVVRRGQASIDAQGNMWVVPGENGNIGKYDARGNSWQVFGFSNYESGGGSDIDRKRNQLYVMYTLTLGAGPYPLRRFDLNSAASLNADKTYTEITPTGESPLNAGESPGFVYVDSKDLFFSWAGGKDIFSLNPVSNVWTRKLATGDDPGPQQINGTYGRFRYSARYGVFILVNDIHQNVFIYKP